MKSAQASNVQLLQVVCPHCEDTSLCYRDGSSILPLLSDTPAKDYQVLEKVLEGVATSVTIDTLTVDGASWTPDEFSGLRGALRVKGKRGSGAKQVFIVDSNTEDTIKVSGLFKPVSEVDPTQPFTDPFDGALPEFVLRDPSVEKSRQALEDKLYSKSILVCPSCGQEFEVR